MNFSRTASPNAPGRGLLQLDLYAAVLSGLCIAHCFALPVLITVLALSIPYSENEVVHVSLVLAAVPATLWVMFKSFAGRRWFVWVAGTGLSLLLAGTFVPTLAAFEEPLSVFGALLLGAAHLWHWHDVRASQGAVEPGDSQGESFY